MSDARQSLRDGNLQQALQEVQAQVRADPAAVKHRVFLFQLLAVLGDWSRALNQLSVAAELDASTLPMAQTYREAIRCEALRADVFAGRRTPLIFGEPAEWIALLLQALGCTAEGRHEEAAALRERAFEGAPTSPGQLDGTPFEWIADADPRLGPVLEVVLNGSYYWVPLQRIAEVEIEKPEDLRDMVWAPAHFRWANGGETVGLIPTRYPGSESHASDAVRLSRRTEWSEPIPGTFLGAGQRVLATDAAECALLDARKITLGDAAAATE